MRLTWYHDAHSWVASCGEDRRGEARVLRGLAAGWVWFVDMEPCSDGSAIVANAEAERLDDAKAAAERQVQQWPTPLEGAWRI